MVLQAVVAGSVVDGAIVGLLAFAVLCFAPLTVFVRAVSTTALGSDEHFPMAV
jgi:hypothetical protein